MTLLDTGVPLLDLQALHAPLAVELQAAIDAVTSTSAFVGGAPVAAFEREFADYCGVAHAVGVGNGTDALELTLCALGIGPGDEVVVQSNTFIATAEAVSRIGARPVFVDVDPGTLQLTPELVAAALTPRTAAVVVVHLYGQMPDMDAMAALVRRAGLALVEDAAQAHGATWRGRRAGSFGDAACFSFYPGKNLGAWGDGGAVVTEDGALASLVRRAANHGRDPGAKYLHSAVGRNSRLDGLQAAVLSAKLPHLDAWNASRRDLVARYRRNLRDTPVAFPVEASGAGAVHHLNVALVAGRDRLRQALLQRGVQTGVHYPVPCHLQPAYQSPGTEPLPVTEGAARQLLSLPLTPGMPEGQVDLVCELVAELAERGADA